MIRAISWIIYIRNNSEQKLFSSIFQFHLFLSYTISIAMKWFRMIEHYSEFVKAYYYVEIVIGLYIIIPRRIQHRYNKFISITMMVKFYFFLILSLIFMFETFQIAVKMANYFLLRTWLIIFLDLDFVFYWSDILNTKTELYITKHNFGILKIGK